MGFMDKVKGLLGQHEEKVDDAIDKAADVVDDKTGGEHTDKIDAAAEKAKDVVEDLADDAK
jgi:hypothetical protein